LQHDQLLAKFREVKAHLKKHKKYLGRREIKIAEKHLRKTPKYSLSSVIKDRYPTFVDALRDLDDALCLIALFAQFPQHLTLDVKKEDLVTCNRLYRDFMLYCTVSQCFTKSFLSIKGVYYRVEIMGQQVSWICPYKFNQRLPFDVDYKVMGTFTEFYIALLRFINYKLFTDLGMSYPVDEAEYPWISKTNSLYLDSDRIRDMQASAIKMFKSGGGAGALGYEGTDDVDEAFKNTPEFQGMQRRRDEARKQKSLFAKCTFLLGRETPIYIIQHLILSFGGQYVLQDQVNELSDKEEAKVMKTVTHVVMDRPLSNADKAKEYIQP